MGKGKRKSNAINGRVKVARTQRRREEEDWEKVPLFGSNQGSGYDYYHSKQGKVGRHASSRRKKRGEIEKMRVAMWGGSMFAVREGNSSSGTKKRGAIQKCTAGINTALPAF